MIIDQFIGNGTEFVVNYNAMDVTPDSVTRPKKRRASSFIAYRTANMIDKRLKHHYGKGRIELLRYRLQLIKQVSPPI